MGFGQGRLDYRENGHGDMQEVRASKEIPQKFKGRMRRDMNIGNPTDEFNYDIIRFYRNGNQKVVRERVSLEVAKAHCRDPLTKKEGKWYDGYIKRTERSM